MIVPPLILIASADFRPLALSVSVESEFEENICILPPRPKFSSVWVLPLSEPPPVVILKSPPSTLRSELDWIASFSDVSVSLPL